MKLILASASVRRAEILHDAGFSFTVLSSAVDETPYPGESPHDLVQRLAAAKAELVASRAVGPAIVIGADTIVTLEGHIFGKPRSSDDARHMLEKLSGHTHAVVTGVALIRLPDAERLTFVEPTLVHFAALSAEEISRYLATGEPHDKAGAYAIQGRAGRSSSPHYPTIPPYNLTHGQLSSRVERRPCCSPGWPGPLPAPAIGYDLRPRPRAKPQLLP